MRSRFRGTQPSKRESALASSWWLDLDRAELDAAIAIRFALNRAEPNRRERSSSPDRHPPVYGQTPDRYAKSRKPWKAKVA